jgi:DNA-binding NarL/FixJ family response regulator
LRDDAPGRLPASNDEIAAELHLSVGAVKMHLRSLFAKFGVEHLRQNEKRLRLATEAIDGGVVSRRDAAGSAR